MIPPLLLLGFVVGLLGRRWNRRQIDGAILAAAALVWGVIVGRESVLMFLGGAAFGAANLAVAYVAAMPWSTNSRTRASASTDEPAHPPS